MVSAEQTLLMAGGAQTELQVISAAGRSEASMGSYGTAHLRVRYAETDKMGVVYNSNYLIWFEIGRVELMRDLGHSYREIEQDGFMLPIAEVTCRFKSPAVYDDEIRIHTSILKLRRALIQFGYEVFREPDGKLLATGTSTHFVTGPDAQQRRPLPDKFMLPFSRAMESAAGESRRKMRDRH